MTRRSPDHEVLVELCERSDRRLRNDLLVGNEEVVGVEMPTVSPNGEIRRLPERVRDSELDPVRADVSGLVVLEVRDIGKPLPACTRDADSYRKGSQRGGE